MNDALTEVRFWAQVMGDSKRTIVCPPDLESRIKGWIDARGMSGLLKVEPNRWCPADRVFVIDTPALEGYMNQAMPVGIRLPHHHDGSR